MTNVLPLLALLICAPLCLPRARAAAQQAPAAGSITDGAGDVAADPATQRQCEADTGSDAQFAPLAAACRFVLSPHNLPNYVCRETTERFINDQKLDVVTADVTFVKGHGDRHTNIAVEGQPVDSLRGTPGWISFALFGTQVTAIFLPRSMTKFEFERERNVDKDTIDTFSFRFHAADNIAFRMVDDFTGLKGSITVDKTTGQLLRIESTMVEAPPELWITSYQSTVTYGNVTIHELGTVLTPVEGEVHVCGMSRCFRNELKFDDCHKFKATSRIVQDQP